MKKLSKLLSFVLAIILTVQLFGPTASAASNIPVQSEILVHEINETSGELTQIESYDSVVFYIHVNDSVSYCSQISPSYNNIQFSYINLSTDASFESISYDLDALYSTYGINPLFDTNYENLNEAIINNLDSFQYVLRPTVVIPPDANIDGASSLSSAITSVFGSNYSNVTKGSASKSYNGANYTVYCKESQSTSHIGSYYQKTFAAGAKITEILSWIAKYGHAATAATVLEVLNTAFEAGETILATPLDAHLAHVTCDRTRSVTVSGYSGTQYWAGWTLRKLFFKGHNGWSYNSGYISNVKHSDYDNITGLMNTGFQNFIDNILS